MFPDCGLGSDHAQGGPCTGYYGNPSDAGAGVFSSISSGPVVGSFLVAALLLAVVVFTVWVARVVGVFFGERAARVEAEERAAQRLADRFERRFDLDRYLRECSNLDSCEREDDLGRSVVADDDREADTEDDGEDDREQARDNLNKGQV